MANEKQVLSLTSDYTFEYGPSHPYKENNSLDHYSEVEKELIKIQISLNKLSKMERKLIYDKYICVEKKSDIALYLSYSISESTFYRNLNRALIHFAEAYDCGKILNPKKLYPPS
ncbi:hypothetical protein NIE88_09670 [Sporolactobacillus shoreicorticis]|nr:hypothetical protein [Sporolactobacillus shoreicorticis]